MHICVYGSANDTIPQVYLEAARDLGRLIGQHGHTLVFGGGDTGVMGEAARGAHEAGGQIVGIAPTFFDVPGILSPLCTKMIFTETMGERKQLLERESDLFIVAPGGIGTMDEFFDIFTLRTLGRHEKPVCLLNVNGCYDGLVRLLRDMVENGFLTAESFGMLTVLQNMEEVEALLGGSNG